MTYYIRDSRAWIKGLVMGCPFGEAQVDCPLKNIRKKPLAERLSYVNNLTDSEVSAILLHHRQCLELREKEIFT